MTSCYSIIRTAIITAWRGQAAPRKITFANGECDGWTSKLVHSSFLEFESQAGFFSCNLPKSGRRIQHEDRESRGTRNRKRHSAQRYRRPYRRGRLGRHSRRYRRTSGKRCCYRLPQTTTNGRCCPGVMALLFPGSVLGFEFVMTFCLVTFFRVRVFQGRLQRLNT